MAGTKQPRVTLTYAQSLDGSIAVRSGGPLSLSGAEATRYTHQLRAAHDAILVGIGTVLSDNPQLNVRFTAGASPRPIVLDSELRCPLNARCLEAARRPIIVTSERANVNNRAALEAQGVTVLSIASRSDDYAHLDLAQLLGELLVLEVRSVMVEGGAQVITSFLRSRLVDRLIITIAPILVGGLHGVVDLLSDQPLEFPRLRQTTWQKLGNDWVVTGIPEWGSQS